MVTPDPLPDPLPDRPASPAATDLPWLVADIGGTNARFGWVADPGAGVTHVQRLAVADHADPLAAVRAYLSTLPPGTPPPVRAAFALATPITGDVVALTNCPWRFDRTALRSALGLSTLRWLNDFEALARSLPRLSPARRRATPGPPWRQPPRGTLAVIGPGTGLGVAGLVATPQGGWLALPGEGGHATLAPADDAEGALLAWVRQRHGHVSAERLLSGTGLPLLHAALAAVHGRPAPDADIDAETVVAQAQGGDRGAVQTLDAFCALLGGFAGNVALTLGARGGLAIGGGIVPRLGARFDGSIFRRRFEAKGRFRDYLAAVPTAVITDTLAALDGALAALQDGLVD